MRIIVRKTLVIAAGLLGATVVFADFDGSEPLMCSLGSIIECDEGEACRTVTHASVDAPDFLKLNFKKKQFVASTAGVDSAPDDMDNVADLPNHLVIQGVQGTSKDDPLGWSMSINHETGRMVLTGAGVNAGFVVFGACTPL